MKMELLKPYRIQVEVGPMEGTLLPPEWAGAFVNVYVCSENLVKAIQTAESALLEDKYLPLSTYSAWEIDMENLESEQTDTSENQVGPTVADFEALKISGNVIYSGFSGYPPQGSNLQ